jgi:hypothetical protein
VIAYAIAYPMGSSASQEAGLASMQAGLAELGRLQAAAWAVARSSPKLAEAAWSIDREAAACMGVSGSKNIGRLRDELTTFTSLAAPPAAGLHR